MEKEEKLSPKQVTMRYVALHVVAMIVAVVVIWAII